MNSNESLPFFQWLSSRCAEIQSFLCVGLDPHANMLPENERSAAGALAMCKHVVDESHLFTACYKINSAFFEQYGDEGLYAMKELIRYIHHIYAEANCTSIPVILDCKRGDIASTAEAYATACYDYLEADAVTLSPYMGKDSIDPFLRPNKAAFVLCKTSNPSAGEIQEFMAETGERLFEKVASTVSKWNSKSDQKPIGLVMGATDTDALQVIRSLCPDTWILCPGVGAQGGDIEQVCKFESERLIVTVSRSIFFSDDVAHSAKNFQDEINKYLARTHKTACIDRFKVEFLSAAIQSKALIFGSFKLKSGRDSPYFFNSSLLLHGKEFYVASRCLAELVHKNFHENFDVFFGPAYKGISWCSGIAMMYYQLFRESKEMVFNRKETKDHGEGGVLLGPATGASVSLEGKRVLIVDDVITAGTAIVESIHLIQGLGAEIVGSVLLLDRKEVTSDAARRISATKNISEDFGFPVIALCDIDDILSFLSQPGQTDIDDLTFDAIQRYRAEYGI